MNDTVRITRTIYLLLQDSTTKVIVAAFLSQTEAIQYAVANSITRYEVMSVPFYDYT